MCVCVKLWWPTILAYGSREHLFQQISQGESVAFGRNGPKELLDERPVAQRLQKRHKRCGRELLVLPAALYALTEFSVRSRSIINEQHNVQMREQIKGKKAMVLLFIHFYSHDWAPKSSDQCLQVNTSGWFVWSPSSYEINISILMGVASAWLTPPTFTRHRSHEDETDVSWIHLVIYRRTKVLTMQAFAKLASFECERNLKLSLVQVNICTNIYYKTDQWARPSLTLTKAGFLFETVVSDEGFVL